KVVAIGWLPTMPRVRRTPVPALPKSITASGSSSELRPTPSTVQLPSACRVTGAPIARMAAAVVRTSSLSKSPEIVVRPTASAPNMRDRWDTDLSPGTWTRPDRAEPGRAIRGQSVAALDIVGFRGCIVAAKRLLLARCRQSVTAAPTARPIDEAGNVTARQSSALQRESFPGTRAIGFDRAAVRSYANPLIQDKGQNRGETRTRHKTAVRRMRRKILRSQPRPDHLS